MGEDIALVWKHPHASAAADTQTTCEGSHGRP
jgi:hypothetical protein